MRTLAPGLHVHEAPQRFLGLEVGARMTVLDLGGDLLVHSPVALDPAQLAPLGAAVGGRPEPPAPPPRRPVAGRGPGGLAAPGLPERRPDLAFAGVLTPGEQPFGPDVGVHPLSCFPFTNEVVLHHRPSRTLIVTDLVFHFTPTAPWLTRAAMTLACGYPGCRTTVVERVGFHRPTARREIAALLTLDFDRLVLAHGEVLERGGREALRSAFGWLGV